MREHDGGFDERGNSDEVENEQGDRVDGGINC